MADDVALPSARSASRLDQRARMRAGVVSLAVGVVLLGAKFVAYAITGSTAVLSDALESIVNVVAATFLIASLRFAGIPADHNHPYGHGKIEFFAAVFEGGLIAFAAVAIVWAAVRRLVLPEPIHEIDEGLALTAGAALVNAVLGVFLLREARRLESTALAADGKHVLSDVWTSAGVVAGLALVRLTGLDWLDPLVALAVGAQLAFTGVRLVRGSAGALLDEEDQGTIGRILGALEAEREPGLIRVHHLRALRAGRRTHVDAHLVVPEFWTVERAHLLADGMERRLTEGLGGAIDVMFHVDPCRRAYCPACDVDPCAIRQAPFEGRPPLSVAEAKSPDPPLA